MNAPAWLRHFELKLADLPRLYRHPHTLDEAAEQRERAQHYQRLIERLKNDHKDHTL